MLDKNQSAKSRTTNQESRETTESQLQSYGFQQIGDSPLYAKGDWIIELHPEDRFSILVDYDSFLNVNTIRGIKTGQFRGHGGFSLVTLHNEDGHISVRETTPDGSCGEMRKGAPSLQEFEGKTFDQQLREAGFSESAPGVFTLTAQEPPESIKIVALVKNGKLSRILKPLEGSAATHIDKNTKIIGTGEAAELYSFRSTTETFTSLILQNELMEFSLTPQYGGSIIPGSQRLLRSISPEEAGVTTFKPYTEESGFTVGGLNTTDILRGLSEINGVSLEELEARMRPNAMSMAGFLGPEESLIDILTVDNDFVLSRGNTHQQLATPLKYAIALYCKQMGDTFEYNGQSYKMDVTSWRGLQQSPFSDNTYASSDMRVTNTSNGSSIQFSFLLPEMIERYGFYEGKGTSYRLEPEDILEVFPM